MKVTMMKLRRRRRSIVVHWLVIRSYRRCSFWLMDRARLPQYCVSDPDKKRDDYDPPTNMIMIHQTNAFFPRINIFTCIRICICWCWFEYFSVVPTRKRKLGTKVVRDPILESEKKNVSDQRLILIVWLEECYLHTKKHRCRTEEFQSLTKQDFYTL